MTITIGHEPHDNANDTPQGWNGGNADRKCGSTTNPAADHPDADKDPCHGTSTDFIAMYADLMNQRNTSCTSTGATTGTGHKCDKVMVQYIAVPSNMDGNGEDDPMLPAQRDGSGNIRFDCDTDGDTQDDDACLYFDILGADPYNYGCFRKAVSDSDGLLEGNECSTANGWDTFEEIVDPVLDTADYLNVKTILDEVGSHPGCDGGSETANGCNVGHTNMTRADWFEDAHTFMTTNARAKTHIIGWVYYHALHSYNWRFFNTSAGSYDTRGRNEYVNTFGRNPFFLGDASTYVLDLTP